jgi:hypothetical protein
MMKTKTKQLLSAAVVSGLILSAGGAVFAHGGYGPGWTGPGMHGGGYGMHGGGYGMRGGMMGGMGMMGGPGGMRGFMGGPGTTSDDATVRTNEQLTNLKQALGITAEQETVWTNFAEATRAKVKLMDTHHETVHSGDARGSIDTETHLKMMQEGAQHMQQLATTTRDLYAALTKEQKATADRWTGPHHFGSHHFGSLR